MKQSSKTRQVNKSFYIESLDGIRGLSFLIVFLAHCGAGNLIPGGFGVTVFFFLSGYLITTLLRMEFEKEGKINYRSFFIRRAFRIFPPQCIILGAALLLSLLSILPGKINGWDVTFQFLNFTNYLQIAGHQGIPLGTGVYWSLAVEEHFYLLFPFLFSMLISRYSFRRCALIFLILCLATLLWRISLVNILDNYELRIYRGTDTRIDSILFGCILGIFMNPKLDNIPFRASVWKYLILPAALLVLILTFILRAPEIKETLRYTLQGIALLPVFICAVHFKDWYIFRLFNLKAVKHFGKLTYVLYLVHFIVLYLVQAYITKNFFGKAVLTLAFSIMIAELLYRFVEKPLGLWRHQHFGTAEKKHPAATPAILLEN